MREQVWDGTTRPETLSRPAAESRQNLADYAQRYDWARVFAVLAEHPDLVNLSRPGGTSLYAPLHQAAHGGAAVRVVRRLLDLDAWRCLRTALDERPVDIATRMKHFHLIEVLEPQYRTVVPRDQLARIQFRFHAVIRERAQELVEEHALRLPELEVLQELEDPRMWFPVPGMYGGFSYRLEIVGSDGRLISESWSRVVGGSGQRHEIRADGAVLTDEGFV